MDARKGGEEKREISREKRNGHMEKEIHPNM